MVGVLLELTDPRLAKQYTNDSNSMKKCAPAVNNTEKLVHDFLCQYKLKKDTKAIYRLQLKLSHEEQSFKSNIFRGVSVFDCKCPYFRSGQPFWLAKMGTYVHRPILDWVFLLLLRDLGYIKPETYEYGSNYRAQLVALLAISSMYAPGTFFYSFPINLDVAKYAKTVLIFRLLAGSRFKQP